jgi:hypothetical protein
MLISPHTCQYQMTRDCDANKLVVRWPVCGVPQVMIREFSNTIRAEDEDAEMHLTAGRGHGALASWWWGRGVVDGEPTTLITALAACTTHVPATMRAHLVRCWVDGRISPDRGRRAGRTADRDVRRRCIGQTRDAQADVHDRPSECCAPRRSGAPSRRRTTQARRLHRRA